MNAHRAPFIFSLLLDQRITKAEKLTWAFRSRPRAESKEASKTVIQARLADGQSAFQSLPELLFAWPSWVPLDLQEFLFLYFAY